MGRAFAGAYRALTQAQKPARGVSLYSRHVNRPLGKVIAAASARVGLGPNGVTVVSALLTTGAALVAAGLRPSILTGVVVALLIILGFAFDSADGQLARLLGQSSPFGEWFDHVVDAGKAVCLHGAVLVGVYRFVDVRPVWLLVPLAFALVAVVLQAGGTLRELLGRLASGGAPRSTTGSPWAPVVLLVADSGVFGLLFLSWGWPSAFAVLYSLLFLANLGVAALLLRKWSRELLALGRG